MKEFNLEEALAGKPVVTRGGRDVTQITKFDCDSDCPIMAVIGGVVFAYAMDGRAAFPVTPADNLCMKEETMIVNGFEIVKCEVDAPTFTKKYYIPATGRGSFYVMSQWSFDEVDIVRLERGIVHLTEENAIAHAKAMLGIDPSE